MFFNNTSPRTGDKQQQLRDAEDRLAEQVSAIQINAELLITECGFDVHLCHGIRANGGCSCPRGRKCPDIGKHPRGKEWQRRSTRDPAEIDRRLEEHPISNLGIRTGNGLVVVDLDLLPGGIERFAEWEAKVGPVPRGHVVQTGSGGRQIYASVPVKYSHLIGSSQGETNGLGPGIDIRAKGGQVVAAPSIHKSGNQYRWLTFTPGEPEELSQAWIDLLCELSPPAAEPQARKRRRRIGTPRTASNRPRPGERAGRNEAQQRADVCGLICNICDCDPKSDVVNRIGTTLIRCQVTGHRMTHTNISRLARGLKNIPELADKTAEDVLPLFEFWFNVGRKNMTDKSWRSVKQRCIYVWDEWAVTEEGPAWDAAREIVTPALLVEAKQSEHAGQFILKAICNYIQEQAEDGLWYLPCRTGQDVLNSLGFKCCHMTVARWISKFVERCVPC